MPGWQRSGFLVDMNISYNWLKQFIDVAQSPDELSRLLTSTGLEVDGIETVEAVPGGLAGLVIGTVLTCERHPDADKLSLTTVDVGGETPLSIVCGAANVAAGQRVVVATVGATLYPTNGTPFQIKKAKIRGAASEGMICAEDEIGLGTSHDGIMVLTTDVPNGTPAAQFFQLEADHRIEIGLTPNRADAASHLGVARDLRALLGTPVQWPSVEAFRVGSTELTIPVRVENPDACPRYMALTLSGLTVRESPDWLKKRLLSIGLTPINNVVDVTNFVLHGLGQPMHAFDADAITTGEVVVKTLPGRGTAAGTPFTTLDGVERTLTATDLMICNGDAEGMCIGGVFGGKTSGVSEKTERVFLECAYFSPASIRKTATHHGLKTDASFRYERGTDPNLPPFALKYAALLIQEVAGGYVSSEIIDVYPQPIAPFRVPVTYRHIDRLIGIRIDRQRIHDILFALDIETEELTETGFTAVVPPYRVDVTREADVVEEILRIYGLDNVPLSESLAADTLSEFPVVDVDQLQGRVGTVLAANGFVEAMSLSMTRPAYHDAIRDSLPLADVRLLNPLSEELSVMRQSMVFSLLDALVYNLNRRQRDLKLFEFGKVYGASPNVPVTYHEAPRLALAMVGNTTAESWQQPGRAVAFHDLKAAVHTVLSSLRIRPTEQQAADPTLFQYGLTYALAKKPLVAFGLLHPNVAKLADAKVPVYYADFDWALLMKRYSAKASYVDVPRFPEVRRDLSLVIDRSVQFLQIEQVAKQTERKLLTSLNVFDVYEGANLGAGKKAYAVSFTLQDPTQTLTDAVIDKTMQRLMTAFEKELGATIRK